MAEGLRREDERGDQRDIAPVRHDEHQRLLRGLDPQQRHAVTTDAAPLAVVAAAGSGKTMVLTRRIARRISDGSADAQHVLALTFTRDAAGELRRRLRRLDVRDSIESGTFHAVALRLLRDRALTTNTAAPVIAPDRHRLIREVMTETRLRRDPTAVMADLDWARVRMIEPEHFGDATRKARRRSTLDGDAFVAVSSAYTALKRRRGVVDFDDLLAHVLTYMQRDSHVRRCRAVALPPPVRRRGAGPEPVAVRGARHDPRWPA